MRQMQSLTKNIILYLFPIIYAFVDVLMRLEHLKKYGVEKIVVYLISIFLFSLFFIGYISMVRWISKRKIIQFILVYSLSMYVIVTIIGSYLFSYFNGFFPNFYTFEYFINEPLSASILIKDSITGMELCLFIATSFLLSLFFFKIVTKETNTITKKKALILFLISISTYSFLVNQLKKYDQCLLVDINFTTAITKHLINFEKNRTFKGKGLEVHHGLKMNTIYKKDKPNVLVIIFESLRKQNLGIYGYNRPTTPNLTLFKKENKNDIHQFKNPYTVSTTTMLGVPAIVTGITPYQSKKIFYEQPFIWSYAKAMNYNTFFLSSHTLKWYRFDRFYGKEDLDIMWNKDVSKLPFYNDLGIKDEYTTGKLKKLISNSKKSFFAIVQYNTTHYPYRVEPKLKHWKGTFRDEYDNAIHKQDAQIGELIKTLKKTGKLKNTIIVITSDHGESLKEHNNIGHVDNYYAQTISIPLLFYIPSKLLNKQQALSLNTNHLRPVSSIDIAPTLIELLNIDTIPQIARLGENYIGKSLCKPIDQNRAIITQNNNGMANFRVGLSVVKNDLHYILRANVNPIEEEVYNIKKDPSEIHNIINHIPKDKLKELKSSFYKYQVSKVFYEKYKVK